MKKTVNVLTQEIVNMLLEAYKNTPYEQLEYSRMYYNGGTDIIISENGEKKRHLVGRVVFDVVDNTNEIEKINTTEKFNEFKLVIYPSGEYESLFIWNEEAYQKSLRMGFIVNLDWFFNRLNDTYIYAPDLLRKGFVMYPDGSYINSEFSNVVETGYCIIERKNGFFNMYGEVFTNDKLTFPFVYEPAGSRDQTQVSSEYIQDIFKNLYEMTDVNGELYGVYPRWNKMTIQINSSTLDFDKDVSFEWREETT